MKIVRWFRSLFAWHAVRSQGVWILCENSVTGQRSAHWRGGCYGPLCDDGFLRDGDIVHGPRGTYVIGEESEIWAS
jgi:hypothetical protein